MKRKRQGRPPLLEQETNAVNLTELHEAQLAYWGGGRTVALSRIDLPITEAFNYLGIGETHSETLAATIALQCHRIEFNTQTRALGQRDKAIRVSRDGLLQQFFT